MAARAIARAAFVGEGIDYRKVLGFAARWFWEVSFWWVSGCFQFQPALRSG